MLLLGAALLAGSARAAPGSPATPEPAPPVPSPPCEQSDAVAVFSSPRTAQPGASLRVLAVSEPRRSASLVVADPDGAILAEASERHGGPPYWWYVELEPAGPGTYRAMLRQGAQQVACREIEVGTDGHDGGGRVTGAWAVTRDWSRATENLFSAWIEHLFDDPLDAEPSWHALHEVTRDPARNFLHDHLALGEDDERGLRLEPDCADFPYFLRAYFAWKLGLPFGYSECSPGGGTGPPRCGRWHSQLEKSVARGSPLQRMQLLLARRVADTVQSSAGRTPADDDRSDFYPIALTRDALRPGTVYADPYGHMLVVVRRVPQTAAAGGILLAVDAQPDGTVARKRFWRGNFLFVHDPALGTAGFKRFRPIVRVDGALHRLTNDEIARDPAYGDVDLEQADLDAEEFYDHVDAVLSPRPQDPARVLTATVDALDEQVRARVRSVANGEAYVAKHPGTIAMPEGAAMFETTGPWEDYSTPARDLRLLIGIDVVRAFPDTVASRPERFALLVGPPAPGAPAVDVRAELEALLAQEVSSRRFEYTRSDGSPWTLSLADVIARAAGLEMAYNPNDCVEVRWAAPPRSDEAATCRRRAPAEQAARMRRHREWFHDRRRPPR
jgi:hypothetical protein